MKKRQKERPPRHRALQKNITHPKLMLFLLLLLALPLMSFVYNAYKDWDNAQTIRGLASDFPVLVQSIEEATGLTLESRANCSVTQEKYGDGVRTCELLVVVFNTKDENYDLAVRTISQNSSFALADQYENGNGQQLRYRRKDSCGIGLDARGKSSLSLFCITAVRDANIDLAREVFLGE